MEQHSSLALPRPAGPAQPCREERRVANHVRQQCWPSGGAIRSVTARGVAAWASSGWRRVAPRCPVSRAVPCSAYTTSQHSGSGACICCRQLAWRCDGLGHGSRRAQGRSQGRIYGRGRGLDGGDVAVVAGRRPAAGTGTGAGRRPPG